LVRSPKSRWIVSTLLRDFDELLGAEEADDIGDARIRLRVAVAAADATAAP
jgi:hypothetical protein